MFSLAVQEAAVKRCVVLLKQGTAGIGVQESFFTEGLEVVEKGLNEFCNTCMCTASRPCASLRAGCELPAKKGSLLL